MDRRLNFGAIFWGLLLILLGGLALLHNFSVVSVDFGNLLRLWPLLLVAAGVSMLSLRGWLGTALAIAVGVAVLGSVTAAALGWWRPHTSSNTPARTVEVRQSGQQVQRATVAVDGGAGRITIGSGGVSLVSAKLESTAASLRQRSETRGDRQSVAISLESAGRWWRGDIKNDLSVTLTESLPLTLLLDTGAAQMQGDLSAVKLERLDIDSGASGIDVRLGANVPKTEVNIEAGMSSVTLALPKQAGVSLRLDAGLSNRELPGLRQTGDDYFTSDNYASAANRIDIRGSIGMSNLELTYY
ncbi:hypothetical protein JNJ66_06525 [Candidatus Saccharibacteria bacterium]|nr:hypothetical protein [Candidatus Saccharibacteria bacterium]